MSPVNANGYTQASEANSKATALLDAFNALEPVSVAAPTITESTVLGPDNTIVITNNQSGATIKYTIKYNDGTTTDELTYTDGTEIKPFNGATTYSTATVTAYATISGDDSKSVSATYTLYNAPTIAATDNQIITDKHTIAITSNNATAGVIQYSYDGLSWTPYTGIITPFKENTSTSVNIYAREVYGNAISAVTTVTNLIRKATFGIYSSTGDDSFNSTSKFIIADADTYSDDIMYTLKVDGVAQSTVYTYDKVNGIEVSGNSVLSNAKIIEITAYAVSQESIDQKVTARFFNSDNYNPLAYRESFDGASVSGTKFSTGSSTGVDGTLANADTASVVSGAGYVDGNGNSPDWRNNVLKIEANATAPGNTITFDSNPLADVTNAAIASQSGVTISFWRHMEDTSGNTVNASKTWLNGLTFQSKSETYQYLLVETSGYVSRSAGAQGGSGDYVDVKPVNQNITQHAAGNDNGRWVQIAVTIDPENGVTVYANGETHDVDIVANGNFTGNDAALAQEILAFITDSNTSFTLCNGITYEGNDCNIFLDDIRLYSTVLSQVDINNMYVDKYADIQTGSSTGHDPTAVTVYTLTDGTQVGETYVQKYGYESVADIDYYIFGTGMTIYHSEDNVSWEVVGDANGKCGYQNEGLFGDVYTTALAEPLAYAATDSGRVGAGKLVWAPHVIYNVNTNKWCYYGSTSSWGSQISAIFLCESSTITGPYTYKSIVHQSSGHPNAIDPAVYYNADFTQLYMVYGSWGGDNAIYVKKLMTDGTDMNAGSTLVCRGLNTGLETGTTASGGSGEGAFVIYENGYYYLYVSVGQNEGNYVQRVFRSTQPDTGFVDASGISATDNTTSAVHGNQIFHSFDSPLYDYMYTSTGHNSVYKAKNNKGEYVTVNSVHARPFANENHGWKALEDGAFSTRQVDLDGNVSLQNMIAYTDDNWPIIMPYQYNGTDTVTDDLTAQDIEGVYTANDMMLTVNYDVSQAYSYSMVAISDTEGISYGVRDNGEQFRFKYVITKNAENNTNYIDFYNEADDTKVLSGVIGTHTVIENGVSVKKPQIGIVNTSNGEHTMAYRSADLPNPDAESLGDFVSVDSIIYTHKANDQYTMYGQEISDNFTYGQSGSTAERCTTITVKYPYVIDTSNATAVYCLSDEERCKNGAYTGSTIEAVDLNGEDIWIKGDGSTATTAQVAAMSASEQSQYYKRYGMQGTVSNYFKYDTTTGKYTDSGVELIITYEDVNTGTSYGEFEFCYVMPNPAWAHSIAAIRNQKEKALLGDIKGASISFVRLPESVGTSTSINSDLINSANGSEGSSSNLWAADGNGNFNYLSAFGNDESVNYDYTQPDKIAQAFNFYDSSVGTSSGSYYAREHTDDGDQAYGVAPNVVNADYYIDYSDTDNSLITRDSSGVPTGYKFELKASNMYWKASTSVKGATSVYRNTTGLGVTYSSTASGGNIFNTMQGFSSPSVDSASMLRYNRSDQSTVQSYFKDGDGNLQTAFPTYDNGYSATNAWNGVATFTGKNSVAKNTDTTSAETYANYIVEVGVSYTASNGIGGNWAFSGENYHYYNIGVNTCDKGATRYFAENVLGKTFEIDEQTGKLTITGDLASKDYTVASYQEYLDAIADCYWFVENPYNTTYADSSSTKEYTTAYDSDGTPIFNTTTTGNNIFGDGTTTTDAVQAEKIQKVIDAYNNLFKKQDYVDAQEKYENLVNQAESLKTELELNPDVYTADTVSIFNSFVGNIEPCYTYYLDKDNPVAGEEYWRYTELSGSEYNELNEAIDFMSKSLMKRVDTSDLTPVIEAKTTERDNGIYTDDVQTKSLGSWMALNSELNTANDYISQVDTVDANGFKVGKFAVTGTGTYTYKGNEYIYQKFDSTDTGATDANGTYSAEPNFSDLQNSIYGEDEILNSKTLADVDTEDSYNTFDYAADVIATLDSGKYTADGLTYITAILEQLRDGINRDSVMQNISPSCVGKHVYASSEDIETYNTVMGTSLPLDTQLRSTSQGETDPLTSALLTLITELNTTYTVTFDSDLTIMKDGVQQGSVIHDEKYYGDVFGYDVSSYVTEGYVVTWDVVVYDKDGKESSSERISSSAGPVINKVADTNVRITANIQKGTADTGYVVIIKDVYGAVDSIQYSTAQPTVSGDTITIDASTYTAEAYPLYDFSKWNENVDGNVYTYKPVYIPQGTYEFKAQDGATLTGVSAVDTTLVASYDTLVTVNSGTIADFYAWAVKTADGKYQVVSYSPSYSFYACANEEYVAITGNSTSGYMVDGQAVTASIIEDAVPYNSIGSITPDQFVTNKLTNKAPFVYIQNTGMFDGNTRARVYARYTEGCSVKPTNFGVIYKSGAVSSNDGFIMGATLDGKKVYTYALNNVLDSGQFVFTLNKATAFNSAVSYRAYINYNFDYTAAGTTTQINAIDYSEYAVAALA
ncbi:MAG: family 43 glycosylhydrolase [Eubacterium sp.]